MGDGEVRILVRTVELVIITYRSMEKVADGLVKMIDGALRIPGLTVLIVDNSEDGQDGRALAALYSSSAVRILSRPDNPGFAEAVNLASSVSDAEWILLINPDVEVGLDELGAICESLHRLSGDYLGAAIGQSTNGLVHRGVGVNRFGWFVDRPAEFGSHGWPLEYAVTGEGKLWGPSGGAGAFRRERLLALGGFYAPLFAWGEDADFAIRAAQQGEKTAAIPLTLNHLGGHSVSSSEGRRFRVRILIRNRVVIAGRLYSNGLCLLFFVFSVVVLLAKSPRLLASGTLVAWLSGFVEGCRLFPGERRRYSGVRLGIPRLGEMM